MQHLLVPVHALISLLLLLLSFAGPVHRAYPLLANASRRTLDGTTSHRHMHAQLQQLPLLLLQRRPKPRHCLPHLPQCPSIPTPSWAIARGLATDQSVHITHNGGECRRRHRRRHRHRHIPLLSIICIIWQAMARLAQTISIDV